MASGTIPVISGGSSSVIDITPIPASSSNPNTYNFQDIVMKYVNGIVFFQARVTMSGAGGPYSHYCIPAEYAPSMSVVLSTMLGSDSTGMPNAFASVSGSDPSTGNRNIRLVVGNLTGSTTILIYGSWPVAT